jgi:hypothetical protein
MSSVESVSPEGMIICGESRRVSMDQNTQQGIAVWTVFLLPVLVFGGFLLTRNQLTLDVVGIYWFPVIVLTVIGVIPPP